jgi:chromosome segregation protein
MKIKKVSITGFKSFLERLEILFPVGLSAIVGPNGCGKSNIVDAIRWAMGEQSAKALRGRQMEDIIFNGSEQSKPLGMAEVSILLENGHGSLPVQFAHESEVAITRRLYRSGESEYLINNVPCRLKDIQEMFMDTGLGNRAYSIIGQGKIGSIVEQKPEETRAMIEEAAGITKYKKKLEESERKIESAQANLQRVEDILGEVERQIRSLKRQAAKARRYKAVGEEIRRLELILDAHAYQELKEESGKKLKSTQDLVQEEITRSANFSSIQAKIGTMNLELEVKDQEIAGLRQTYLLSKEKVNKKESMLESVAAERRMQAEMENRLRKEREDLGRRLQELEQEKRILLEKIGSIKQTAIVLEDESSMAEARAKHRHEFLKQVKEAYEEARTRVSSGISKEMSLNQDSGYINTRIRETTDSRARLEKEKGEVALKMENAIQACQRKIQVREALALKLKDIERDIAREQDEFHELDQTGNAIEADLRSVESNLNMNQSRLTSLRSLTENFEGYKIGVRTIMKASDLEARREGRIMGLVADVIRVEPAYEEAVEAILGDKLQYIIVETQRDGKEAIEYLKIHAKGRSSFVPIKDLNGKEEKGNHNGFPLLRDMVSVPDPYGPLMDALFGNAALVPDLNRAISAWANDGKDQCLVTPEGDVVDRSGILSGGKLAHSSHGILARKREMHELEGKVAGLLEDEVGLKSRREKIISQKQGSEAALRGLHEEKANCQDRINDTDKVNFQLSHEVDQLERMVARINSELEQKDKEQNGHKEALSRIESELSACKEKREEEEAYLKQKEAELKESEEEFERFRNELSRLKMEHSLALEERRGLTREVERIDEFAREAQGTFTRIEGDIVTAREKYEDGGAREGSMREELNVLHEKLKLAEEAMNLADQDRNQLRNDIREEEKKAEGLRGELEILKERIHTARMEQSEFGFRMDGLANMVREKYNLHLEDAYKEYLSDDYSPTEIRERLEHQKKIRGRLGEVNLTAIQEHEALKERYAFITNQRQDLLDSIDSLNEAIRKINRTSLDRFTETFAAVDQKLKIVFPILFNGGSAGLRMLDETKPLESGVLVEVQPPGKRLSHMGLLSGGEKALVAMALIFAIYLIKPSPFLLLDEVDAPLDEANIDRFNDLLREIRKYSQIILVTHNRRSMEIVDRLYGVTMEKQGISKIVSVNLESLRNG